MPQEKRRVLLCESLCGECMRENWKMIFNIGKSMPAISRTEISNNKAPKSIWLRPLKECLICFEAEVIQRIFCSIRKREFKKFKCWLNRLIENQSARHGRSNAQMLQVFIFNYCNFLTLNDTAGQTMSHASILHATLLKQYLGLLLDKFVLWLSVYFCIETPSLCY